MKKLLILVIGVSLATVAFAGYYAYHDYYCCYGHHGYPMPYVRPGFNSVPVQQAVEMMRSPPPYARVFPQNDTIAFTSNDVTLVVLTMGLHRAENLTNATPPSYAHHNVFVIYGLINPNIVLPPDARVTAIVVNLDAGDYHNFAVTAEPPPYPYYLMGPGMMGQGGMMGGYSGGNYYNGTYGFVTMMTLLPPANYTTRTATEFTYSFTLPPGTYWYVCTYPGHAQEGMYGKIVAG
ncbi:MAG: plastocyanin/azurin family copper-binding protein [Thermoprotei archaeon]